MWRPITAGFLATWSVVFVDIGDLFDQDGFTCGSSASEKFKEISKQFAREEEALARHPGRRRDFQEIQVNVYMHVVAPSRNEPDGYLSDEALERQFQVLKTDYEPTGIFFNLKSIDKTVNATWASNTDLKSMWHSLHNGSYSDLNLWFIPTLGDYGFCTLPAVGRGSLGQALLEDGCTIRSDTIPGGRAKNYNLGKTVTHEVGHWFGLLHTFEGGCEGDGDYIDDTPAQASPSIGCPEGRDSCPEKPGLDPIQNFMDYSYDACYKEFTPGQVDRMMKVWNGVLQVF
ncbi:hypothetical protein Trco_003551 [Trichoderma cornu-damae]|uniref:Peptidase M43 pregnancy-associated plasma-A domain-containing protein n=1 Tax=Trichoderma cornu-damae TaxID=654480 RepID=A0A9P8TW96_9HYPO|nr:hypothetical protein Trco_003551 [Trichoderma cornu-damae]